MQRMEGQSHPTESQPVTVIIKRQVKPGQEANYEKWLQRFQNDAHSLNGYLGVTTQRPASKSGQPYISVIRFNGLDALHAFETSELRARYLAEVVPYVQADAIWQQMSGLEFWFSPPAGTVVPQPSRFRMALVMIAVVFTLVLSIGSAVGIVLQDWPFPLRLLVTIAIEVFFMTYWLMPRLTRWLAPWIYPAKVT
jgi:uncharacterized protein